MMELRDIGKRYGSNQVLQGIDLELVPGRCIGLVGENGAGKSTLLSIISGKTPQSDGTLRLDGAEVAFKSPREARAQGIEIIPQELAYVPHLSVAENLMMPNWPRGRWGVTQRWLRKAGAEAVERLGLSIDVRRDMIDLSLAERQLVEIAKALLGDARVLILDEPTASLHARETEFLLERLRALKAAGVSLVYVSHHLDESFEISDEIVVLRNGRMEDRSATADTTLGRTVNLMLGAEYEAPATEQAASSVLHEVALRLEGWTSEQQPAIDDVSLEIRTGEIVGIFGLVGSGAETVARALGGHERRVSGTVSGPAGPSPVPASPIRARALGIAYVPAERKTDGLALNQSISENITVMELGRYATPLGVMKGRAQLDGAKRLASETDVRCTSVRQEVGELSGGNQQKVLLASRLAAAPRVLVLHEPTRGVDIGSRTQIHQQLAEFARHGAAVVLVTSDVQEAIDATDRLVVMRDGRVVDELTHDRKTKSIALETAAGGAVSHD
ncbi:sugar ABC transporter ATP-binding protein [Herbiconiux sp. KACC 21604]|uniref:sugar ABC transporter ATP-binding protein n=1 Tax=unclassified Herbiconiux TaxID=2618217 RepID=UPI0014920FDC|nr:sugar ABC transporter ATP-binding protein [Herbiconiux sp. SALV-R1]QJU52810.1 sugar ABC transporter ATP-binding protein [Herbiconiux sp. SALV-R1]WPO87722.1 sugar ABC transporter ATP-binding protein [Herbiconiux sp. KACC 21604]